MIIDEKTNNYNDNNSNDNEKKIGQCCIRGAEILFGIHLIDFLLTVALKYASLDSVAIILLDAFMIFLIAALPLYFSYKIIEPYSIKDYDKKTYADLCGERDQYPIWSALGTFLLTMFRDNLLEVPLGIARHIILSALYMLVIFSIHYRRLSTAIYRKNEPQKHVVTIVRGKSNNSNEDTKV